MKKAYHILFPVLITFFSCSKMADLPNKGERVRLYIDRYTIDTVYLGVTTKWFDDYLSGNELAKVKAIDPVHYETFCSSPDESNYRMDKFTYVFGEVDYKPGK